MTPLFRLGPSTRPKIDHAPAPRQIASGWGVSDEWSPLQSVLLADPRHLSLVPCNSVSREAYARGHQSCGVEAARQHDALRRVLEDEGVTVHVVHAARDMPDLAFTRDTTLMTPWGLVGLSPRVVHRRREVEHALDCAARAGVPMLGRVGYGHVEGGDVALIRSGLVAIGCSGDRTTPAGVASLGVLFGCHGWEVLEVPFDPRFLHLDTLFCMAAPKVALACVEALPAAFLERMAAEDIQIVPVTEAEVDRLGCNVLSLGLDRVVMADSCPRLADELRKRGLTVHVVELSQFLACGGGVHCLTMPLSRAAEAAPAAKPGRVAETCAA